MDNFYTARKILAQNIESVFDAKRVGAEYVMSSPYRSDNKPSLAIDPEKMVFVDRAFSEYKGTILDLYSYINNLSVKDAMFDVINRYGTVGEQEELRNWKQEPKKRGKVGKDDLTPHIPVPSYKLNEGESIIKAKPGFSALYRYTDVNGSVMFWRYRFYKDGEKKVRPFGLFSDENGDFKFAGYLPMFNVREKPMYGLHQFLDSENKRILVVEGEKAADAARKVLVNWIVLSVPNGEASFKTCRIDEIKESGCPVYVWPDADESGISLRSARVFCKRLSEAKVYILDPPSEFNDKDDVFDWLEINDAGRLEQFILDTFEQFEVERVENKVKKNLPFDPLGFGDDSYYYRSGRTGSIVAISGGNHIDRQLLRLTNLDWYMKNFSIWKKDEEVIDWKTAADKIMEYGDKKGPYDNKKLRGRGVWRDHGKPVVFDGEYIHHDGTKTHMLEYESEYCYRRTEQLDYFPKVDKMDLTVLNEFIEELKASNPGQLKYLLGWCVAAPLCGILEWRSHIWVHGESGTGKSTIIEKIAHPLVGNIGIQVKGNSSEAGIRQKIGDDARCMIIDDVKKQGSSKTDKMEKLLDLMRSTSSDTGATTALGTASQNVIERHTKTMFLISSVVEYTDSTEDKNRITPIEMVGKNSMNKKQYKKYLKKITKYFNSGIDKYFRLSIMNNIETILDNVDTFEIELSESDATSRDADQLAPLIAGYYHIMNEGKTATEQEAQKFIEQFDVTDQADRTDSKEYDTMLNIIMLKKLRYVNGIGESKEYSVVKLLQIVMEKYSECSNPDQLKVANEMEEHMALREFGLKYSHVGYEGKLLIACNHEKIKSELNRDYKLGYGYSATLKLHSACADEFSKLVRVSPGTSGKQCLVFSVSGLLEDIEENADEIPF